MDERAKTSRRNILKAGAVSLAASAIPASAEGQAVPKKAPGETKVVAIMGDYWHPAVSQELHVRQIFSSHKDWKFYFVQRSNWFTPELLADADLIITARYGGADSLGWSDEPVVVSRPSGDPYMTDEQEAAIIENVTRRGAGWLAVHCTLFTGRKAIEDLMGVEPVLHQEIQPVVVRDLNQEHPITRGIPTHFFNLDEQFDAEIKDPSRTTVLFRTLAVHDKRIAIGGWCLEQGKGRVVGLLPGHYQWTYRVPEYQEIFWRAAHWALRRDIPPYPGAVRV